MNLSLWWMLGSLPNLKRFIYPLLILGFMSWNSCLAQGHKSLCNQGSNRFRADSYTHVEVTVEAALSNGLAARTCQANLKWEKQTLVVAESAAEVDLDIFDVELEGLGPVAAFQVKDRANECCMTYRIYSLNKPVRLLRTIKGGYFSGADTDLDGQVEIWAEDIAAIDGIDGLAASDVEYPPTYVLRFEKGRLVNASAEFQSHFDDTIANVHRKVNPDDVQAFKQSDGKLASPMQAEQLRRLKAAKIQALEIVWAYLYSGREAEAWETLRVLWPDADIERIQAAIIKARTGGILTQIEGEAAPRSGVKHAQIFENLAPNRATAIQIDQHLDAKPVNTHVNDGAKAQPPQPIDIWRPEQSVPESTSLSDEDELLDLLIDSAGKVRSVQWTDKKKPKDTELMNYALEWKFIPGLQHGHSVACHLRFGVHAKR